MHAAAWAGPPRAAAAAAARLAAAAGQPPRRPAAAARPPAEGAAEGRAAAAALAGALAGAARGRPGRSRARLRRRAEAAGGGCAGGLLVVCGPSGAGKSTLANELLSDDKLKGRIGLVVSHTTRSPRSGEVDGVHYHFAEREEMERRIRDNEFLEYAEVHGNIYGTSFAAIDAERAAGRVCLLDIDLQGVRKLREHLAEGGMPGCRARFVLVTPLGGLATLEDRLRARGHDDEAGIQRRLETAKQELEDCSTVEWDCSIVNQDGNLKASAYALRGVLADLLPSSLVGSPTVGASGATAAQNELNDEVDEEGSSPALDQPRKSVFGEFSGIARQLGGSGVDLGQGFPNFDPPEFVVQALRDELGNTAGGGPRTRHQYTRTAGHPKLVELLAERYSRHLGRPLDPMKNVAVTVGATGGLFLAMQVALEQAPPGAREIVALEPFFELYRSQTKGLDASLVTVPMAFDGEKRSFALDAEALGRALGPQTAALIVNSPHNPTGKAFEEEEMKAIADLVRLHPHLVVISDEVYKYMIFDHPASGEGSDSPAGHIHFANLPGMWERTLTVSSCGKTFGITGWQIGWVVGPSEWLEQIHRFMPNLQFCAPTLMQRALGTVLEAASKPYRDEPSYYEWLRRDYKQRRRLMSEALEAAGITTVRSQGGFFMLADIADLCGPSGPLGASWKDAERPGEPLDWTFCRALASELGIVTLPVSPFFGPSAPPDVRTRFARFCFAKTDATLEEARRRLMRLNVVHA